MIPAFKKVRPGCVKAECGDEVLFISRRSEGRWVVYRGHKPLSPDTFKTLAAAKTFAFDWLAEYA
jgi:ribose 1,5-bisphosphokinase PhnN